MGSIAPDAELLQRCQDGDEKAWRKLVKKYQNLVFSTALSTGLDQESAVDVHQQVWIELHRSLLRIRDAQALPRWLIVTTRRISYRHAVVQGRWVNDVREDMVDPNPATDANLVALEERFQLERALETLGGRCEEVLKMFFYSDQKVTYQEVAEKTGLAEGSVGSLRQRCLDRLRKVLEEEAA